MQLSERTRSIIIALALAAAAALIIVLAVKKSGGKSSTSPPTKGAVEVLVATRDIPASTPGSQLGGSVRRESVPRTDVVAGAISNPSQVENLVSTAPIYSGEQVTIRRFQLQKAEGVVGQITGTDRVIELPGDANQLLAGTLKAGDHVDLVANIKYRIVNFRQSVSANLVNPAALQTDLVATRIVLRNLLVLREPQTPAGAGKFGGTSGYQVLLDVSDNQSQKLFYVLKNADWTLELRPAHSATDSQSSVETTGSVLSDGLQQPQFLDLVLGPRVPG